MSASPESAPLDPDAPTRIERPAGARETSPPPSSAGSEPAGGAGTSAGTAIQALRSEETARARGFSVATAGMATAALLFVPFLGGAPWLRAVMAAGLVGVILASLWVRLKTARQGRYDDRAVLLYGLACVGGSVIFNYYLGVFSPTPIVVTLGIAFFGLGANRRLAVLVSSAATAAWLVLAALLVGGVLPDVGVLPCSVVPPMVRVFFLVMVPLVFLTTLLQARHSRQATLEAVERSNAAVRDMLQREAQLEEANRNLEHALAAGAGHEGRYSGSQAGPWRLGAVLGRGAMGEIYGAVHQDTGEPAAVKLLHHGMRGDPDTVRRFLREGEAASRLRSPFVVSVLEVGQLPDGTPFLAMEQLEGHDLAWHLRQKRQLALPEALEMLEELAAGLDAARAVGVVHRDLKPQNIFLAEGAAPTWKILDFGVSKLDHTSGTLTQQAVVGTPGYMSPEQAQGLEVDHRGDLFALGAVAYRALTGRPPFAGGDLPRILFDIVYRGPDRPRDLAPSLPPDVDLVLAIALAKRADDRFATAPELACALRAAAAGKLDDRLRTHARKLLRQLPWGGVLQPKR